MEVLRMKKIRSPILLALFPVMGLSAGLLAQDQKVNDKILGEWAVEIIGGK